MRSARTHRGQSAVCLIRSSQLFWPLTLSPTCHKEPPSEQRTTGVSEDERRICKRGDSAADILGIVSKRGRVYNFATATVSCPPALAAVIERPQAEKEGIQNSVNSYRDRVWQTSVAMVGYRLPHSNFYALLYINHPPVRCLLAANGPREEDTNNDASLPTKVAQIRR